MLSHHAKFALTDLVRTMLRQTASLAIIVASLSYSKSSADLISHYEAEQNAEDSGGTNHGVFTNAMYASGIDRCAFSFIGSNYVTVPDDDTLDFSDEITIAAWVRPEALGSPDGITAIIWKGDSIFLPAGQSYSILFADDKVAFRISDGNELYQTDLLPIPLDSFTHIAGT